MKKKEIVELFTKPVIELGQILRETRVRVNSLCLDRSAGKLKNFGELRDLKKRVARILTALSSGTRDSQNRQSL